MSDENLNPIAESLLKFHAIESGRYLALRTAFDALIATLGKTLPPLLDVMHENMGVLHAAKLKEIERDRAFDPPGDELQIQAFQAEAKSISEIVAFLKTPS